MSWKTEVTNGGGNWIGSRLRFNDYEEAAAYVRDFKNRTAWVTDVRVAACDGPANHRYVNGELFKFMKIELKPQDLPPRIEASPEESYS